MFLRCREREASPYASRAPTSLALDQIDLIGPTPVKCDAGPRYFLTCYDDNTRKTDITFLNAKSEAFTAMCNYIAKVEHQLGLQVKQIRSDNGGEFTCTK